MSHKIQIDGIERNATQAENEIINQIQIDSQNNEKQIELKLQALISARAKLTALGLTVDEVAAILGS